jgi:WD40 repeat protein
VPITYPHNSQKSADAALMRSFDPPLASNGANIFWNQSREDKVAIVQGKTLLVACPLQGELRRWENCNVQTLSWSPEDKNILLAATDNAIEVRNAESGASYDLMNIDGSFGSGNRKFSVHHQ